MVDGDVHWFTLSLVCAMFSVVGFLFSFCLATTTAAQSGAVAGLGTAFVTKPLLYEVCYCRNLGRLYRRSSLVDCRCITKTMSNIGPRTGVLTMAQEMTWRNVFNGPPLP